MADPASWANIPNELKSRKQWCVAHTQHPDPDQRKIPRVVGAGARGASVTDPSTWSTFNDAAMYAWQHNFDIGYVLSPDDGVTCIDLDVKDKDNFPDKPEVWTTPEQLNMYSAIVKQADSFTEISLSGKAVHIWVKGKIGDGLKHNGVEIYSQSRFIICTGKVIKNVPIHDRQSMLDDTVLQFRQLQERHAKLQLVEVAETHTDAEIWEMAMEADNAVKFNELINGRYQQFNSAWTQSEADLALMSMFTFYSASNEQCRRLFRMTTLGQWDMVRGHRRHKALDNDKYLNFTIQVIRNRQAAEKEIENAAIIRSREVMLKSLQLETKRIPLPSDFAPVESEPQVNGVAHIPPPPVQTESVIVAPVIPKGKPGELSWPPGFAAEIAQYVYQSAPRPVKEVAIVAALGLLAGVCGKAFHIPQSGLNCYLILVARSAVGKEAMHSGLASLLESLRSRSPSSSAFVEFQDYASGPALSKAVQANNSFVHVASEWGKKLKRLSRENGSDSAMETLRTVMTALYQKSGPKSIVAGIKYASSENNVSSVTGVAYSMIGETTPKTYYESLTDSMMEDGFLSRFTSVEFTGERPPLNENALLTPPADLADKIANLTIHTLALNSRGQSVLVMKEERAHGIMRAFDLECDRQINGSEDEGWRQMWNRASLKAMRIAALLACADNYVAPIIQVDHINWAIDLVRRDIALMNRKMVGGEIGMDDSARTKRLLSIIKDYLHSAVPESYGCPDSLRRDFIVPRKVLQLRTGNIGAFSSHKQGSTVAMDQTIKSLCEDGYLKEVPKDLIVKGYDFHGKCFRVLDLRSG